MKGSGDFIKLVKENQIIAIIIAIVIAVSAVYMIVFVPMTKALSAKYAECRLCENQILDARNMIDYARGIDKSYGGRVLISEKEAASGIDEFTKHGKALGVNFHSIKPAAVIAKEGTPYKILPIELDMEATDKQYVDFMGSIDELKKAIVTVDSFDITPGEHDRSRLNIKKVINIYLSSRDAGPEGS